MPTFKYTALDHAGDAVSGSVKAEDAIAARADLANQRLQVTALEDKPSWTQIEVTKSRIKPQQLMYLSRQLAAFVQAGIPLLDAIRELSNDIDKRAVSRVLADIHHDLRSGMTLQAAFARHPRDFPAYYLGILGAAEHTGRLDTVLLQLSDYIERDLEAKRKVRSALMYPSIVLLMAILTIAVLSTFVLPAFAEVFASLGSQLPLPTRMLVTFSNFWSTWWWLIALVVLALVVAGFVVTRFRGGKKFRDEILIRLPAVGTVVRYVMIERFLRILSATVDAGVPIPEAMRVSTEAVTNLVFQDALRIARDQLIMGEGLAEPIAQTGLFPGMATQMFRVGERTGELDNQLSVAANYYSTELTYKINRLTTLVEPAITIVMGLLVGFVAVALVAAIFGIYDAIPANGDPIPPEIP